MHNDGNWTKKVNHTLAILEQCWKLLRKLEEECYFKIHSDLFWVEYGQIDFLWLFVCLCEQMKLQNSSRTEINIGKINKQKKIHKCFHTHTHLCCNLLGLDEIDVCVGRDWNYQRVSLNFQITCNDWDQLNMLELTNWSMSQSSLETICR